MLVESIKLENFRNYGSLELEFDPGTNLFYGDNAQGKTNILEAVYLCGTTRSHKGSKDREMIHFDRDEAHICMRIRKGDVPYRIDMHLKKSKQKELQSTESGSKGGRADRAWEFCVFFAGRSEYHQERTGRAQTVFGYGAVSARFDLSVSSLEL